MTKTLDDNRRDVDSKAEPGGAHSGGGRIVVGVDGSPSSIAAVRRGLTIATALDVPLQVVSAWSYPIGLGYFPPDYMPGQDAEDDLDAIIATVLDGADIPARLTKTVKEGQPAQVLIEASKGAGMLIVGSRGHGGFAGLLLGSVSSVCAAHSSCPVLIMHETGTPEGSEDDAEADRSDALASALIGAR
jgi:nucleotide-binding universal stress UspA family protein